MGAFLIESITPALRQRVQTKKEQWFYADHNAIDGLILYKTLISYGAIGSRAGVDKNKRKLHSLTLKNYEQDVLKMIDDFEANALPNRIKGGDVQ